MPMRKRMSPIARSARSKRRMRPKRRKKPPEQRSSVETISEGDRVVCLVLVKEAYLPPVQNATPTSVSEEGHC